MSAEWTSYLKGCDWGRELLGKGKRKGTIMKTLSCLVVRLFPFSLSLSSGLIVCLWQPPHNYSSCFFSSSGLLVVFQVTTCIKITWKTCENADHWASIQSLIQTLRVWFPGVFLQAAQMILMYSDVENSVPIQSLCCLQTVFKD